MVQYFLQYLAKMVQYPPVQITRASLLRAPNREFDEKPQNN